MIRDDVQNIASVDRSSIFLFRWQNAIRFPTHGAIYIQRVSPLDAWSPSPPGPMMSLPLEGSIDHVGSFGLMNHGARLQGLKRI